MLAVGVGAQYLPARPDIGKAMHTHVARVVDGDTLILSDRSKVRLIGVDTPESHESDKLDRIVRQTKQSKEVIKQKGRMATRFTKQLVGGKAVRLEFDPANVRNDHTDKYGRLLAYVYIKDESSRIDPRLVYVRDENQVRYISLNASLLKAGMAEVFRRFPYEKKKDFISLEADARRSRIGIWASS